MLQTSMLNSIKDELYKIEIKFDDTILGAINKGRLLNHTLCFGTLFIKKGG